MNDPRPPADAARRWERTQALFHAAAELPPPERRAFLERECSADAALLADVLALLEQDAADSPLDRDVAEVADALLDPLQAGLPAHAFGAYRVTGVLGEGGMGVVYRAVRDDLGSLAAIKILRDATLSPSRRERFASEARTLAQLDHPAIARILDADTLPDGTPWFVMEYVEGVPITEFCRTHASPIGERLRLLRAVCEAVQHAHAHAVIHRDLKPSNILVKPDGTVRLLDFGIAKHMDTLDAGADLTRTGLRLMTPAYAAPEQVRGQRLGVHTDIYALGILLYELLTGRLPYDLSRSTPAEAASIVIQQQPERPSLVARGLAKRAPAPSGVPSASLGAWADLDVMCFKAMHKDPARRYVTVDALVRDIDHFLAGEPLEAQPDSIRYRTGKFVRRHWRALAVTATVFVAVVGLVTFYTIRLAAARNAALADAARTARIQRFMLSLFEGGDEEAGPSDTLRVVSLLDQGAREARGLDAEPEVQAELYWTLGGLYQQLGQLDRADSLLQASLDRRRALEGPDGRGVIESLVSLGLLRVDQAKLEDAEQLVREALTRGARTLRPEHPTLAGATVALGRVLEERGDYDQAIPVLEQAVRLHAAAGKETPELVGAMFELANTLYYAGNYPAADSLNRVLLAVNRRLYGERHPSVSENLVNLGAVQQELGHYAQAESLYRAGLDITRAWYGEDHPNTAANLTMVGRSLLYQDRLEDAEAAFRQALAIRERVFGPMSPRVASVLNEMGSLALRRKQYDEAEARFRRTIDIYRAAYGEQHSFIAVGLANLASVYSARQEYGRAESVLRDVLRRYAAALPANHVNVGIGKVKLGRVILRQKRYAEAAEQTLAGYEILNPQMDPGVSFLTAAREDLVAAYEAMRQGEKAARFRAEIAKLEAEAK